jgi:hypothetical protein
LTVDDITLDGSGSYDPDNKGKPDSVDILTYIWESNISGELAKGTRDVAEVVTVNLPAGIHEITLTVKDDLGGECEKPATVELVVIEPDKPAFNFAFIDPPERTRGGKPETIQVRLFNVGIAPAFNVTVKLYCGMDEVDAKDPAELPDLTTIAPDGIVDVSFYWIPKDVEHDETKNLWVSIDCEYEHGKLSFKSDTIKVQVAAKSVGELQLEEEERKRAERKKAEETMTLIGIIVGIIVAVCVALFLFLFIMKKRKAEEEEEMVAPPGPPGAPTPIGVRYMEPGVGAPGMPSLPGLPPTPVGVAERGPYTQILSQIGELLDRYQQLGPPPPLPPPGAPGAAPPPALPMVTAPPGAPPPTEPRLALPPVGPTPEPGVTPPPPSVPVPPPPPPLITPTGAPLESPQHIPVEPPRYQPSVPPEGPPTYVLPSEPKPAAPVPAPPPAPPTPPPTPPTPPTPVEVPKPPEAPPTPPVAEEKTCPNCSAPVQEEWLMCPQCKRRLR